MDPSKQAIVIVGAGFAGLFTALHLRHQQFPGSILMIDPQERFTFKPLLYELLSGELAEDAICPTYEKLLKNSDITFVRDSVSAIDLAGRSVSCVSGTHHPYHYLVLTVGRIQGYRQTEGADAHAFPFRSWEDGKRLERHLRDCLQRALATDDVRERRALLTTAIVGGGPSGVEMAATLADLLPYWYEKLGGHGLEIRIVLLNHSKTILSGDSNAHLQHAVRKAFRSRKVEIEILTEVSATSVQVDRLHYSRSDGQDSCCLETFTTIWTAGTALHPLIHQLESQIPSEHLDRHGSPHVTETLQLPDFPEVFAAGDCVTVQNRPQPALAQVAYQQGTTIAHNLLARSRGTSTKPSNVSLRGTLIKTGIGDGIADLFNKMIIEGTTGGLIRTAAYLELLPTPLRNFKATLRWLDDEIFRLYIYEIQHRTGKKQPALSPGERKARRQVKGLAILAPLAFLVAATIALHTPPRERVLPSSTTEESATTRN